MAWDWFWLQASPGKGQKEVKPQTARQNASQAAGKPFEGAPPPFLGREPPKPQTPSEGN
jgi:hypothetical protein